MTAVKKAARAHRFSLHPLMMAVFLPTLAFASRPLPTHPHLHEPLGSPAFVSLDHPHVLEPLGSPALAALAALTDSSGLAELALPRTERLAPPAAEPRLAREEWPWFVAQPDATEQVADPFSARVAREEAKRARVPAWPTGATLRLSPPPPPPLARRSRPRAARERRRRRRRQAQRRASRPCGHAGALGLLSRNARAERVSDLLRGIRLRHEPRPLLSREARLGRGRREPLRPRQRELRQAARVGQRGEGGESGRSQRLEYMRMVQADERGRAERFV